MVKYVTINVNLLFADLVLASGIKWPCPGLIDSKDKKTGKFWIKYIGYETSYGTPIYGRHRPDQIKPITEPLSLTQPRITNKS